MYETILVATDGSDEASAALAHAIDLAATADATVAVLAVVEPGGSPLRFAVDDVDELNRAADEVVEEVLDVYDDQPVEIGGDVRRGRPAEVIQAYAEEIDADLIVVGQRGADGVTGALLGSTTDRLARATDRPLTIVPA